MARFATTDSRNHSAAVWIITLLSLLYTILTTLVRAAIKFRMAGLDDMVAAVAQLLACSNAFSVIYALVHGLAQGEAQDGDNRGRDDRLHYAGVSEAQTPGFTSSAMLTFPDTASKHHTLPSDISCRESLYDLIPKKNFPKIKSLTRYASMQHLRSNIDSLGYRSRHYSFCQLRSGTHVVVSRGCCLQRSRECHPSSLLKRTGC
jgi:hypothetical protein